MPKMESRLATPLKFISVPAYVVNGKYLIYTKTSNPSISMAELVLGNWPLKNKQGNDYGAQ